MCSKLGTPIRSTVLSRTCSTPRDRHSYKNRHIIYYTWLVVVTSIDLNTSSHVYSTFLLLILLTTNKSEKFQKFQRERATTGYLALPASVQIGQYKPVQFPDTIIIIYNLVSWSSVMEKHDINSPTLIKDCMSKSKSLMADALSEATMLISWRVLLYVGNDDLQAPYLVISVNLIWN